MNILSIKKWLAENVQFEVDVTDWKGNASQVKRIKDGIHFFISDLVRLHGNLAVLESFESDCIHVIVWYSQMRRLEEINNLELCYIELKN